jgi:predicted hotdog family 3-hydroxylacyl-ACP dehydratase
MIGRDAIQQLIPHQGAMCLWDEVIAWDAGHIRLRAANHRDPAHPLRSDGRLHAVHLCEYGAQAMAVHGGLRAAALGGSARPGVLVALRGITLRVERLDDLAGDLEGEAQPLAEDANSQQYAFRITHAGIAIAEGRAAVMLQGDPP